MGLARHIIYVADEVGQCEFEWTRHFRMSLWNSKKSEFCESVQNVANQNLSRPVSVTSNLPKPSMAPSTVESLVV